MYEIRYWKAADGSQPVVDYVRRLKWPEQRKYLTGTGRIQADGPAVKRPTADYLGGKLGLWELRVFDHRVLYTFEGKTAVMLHAFVKKTDRIPQAEIETALKRKGRS